MAEVLYGVSGDIREELGNPTETEVSASIVALGRTRATRVVNGYLEKSFPGSVPFVSGSVPVLIDEITNELATYYVKRLKHPGPAPFDEEVRKEYWDRPIEMLEKIVKEEIKLPELTSAEPARILSNRGEHTPIFDVDNVEEHVLDPDLEREIGEDRNRSS